MPEAELAAALARAKARLDTLDYYPEPVRIERVRIRVAPWFFRVPGFRRYAGYALWVAWLARVAKNRLIDLPVPTGTVDLFTTMLSGRSCGPSSRATAST